LQEKKVKEEPKEEAKKEEKAEEVRRCPFLVAAAASSWVHTLCASLKH